MREIADFGLRIADLGKSKCAWFVASIFCSLLAVGGRAQDGLRVDVNLVNVFLTVQDARGQFVTGLTANDFRVYEDGVEQKIAVFEKEDAVESAIGLLVDNSGSMVDILPMTKAGILTFARTFQRFEELFVMAFGTNVRLLHDVRGSLSRLERELDGLKPRGTTVLYDALLEAMRKVGESEHVRKALIVFADGNDNGSLAGHRDASLEAQRSGVLLYFIAIGSPVHIDKNTIESLASLSGGRVVYLNKTDPVPPAMETIRAELAKQYYVGYYAPRKPGFHQIRVEIPARDVRIRAKTGYFGS